MKSLRKPENWVTTAIFTILLSVSSNVWSLEEPGFTVVGSQGAVEFRQYGGYLIAETIVVDAADREAAANIGFRRLFKYITGDNTEQIDIAMTAPVQQRPTGQKIAMTAPVQQQPADNGWAISFVVPDKFTADTVPLPTNPNITIREVPDTLMAAIRYSGRWTDANIRRHKGTLKDQLMTAGITPAGEMITAFYNAPFSLPFTRRNEFLVPISQIPQT
ncbi:MAG: heme-binding protein [Pseudomonadota bacterium]